MVGQEFLNVPLANCYLLNLVVFCEICSCRVLLEGICSFQYVSSNTYDCFKPWLEEPKKYLKVYGSMNLVDLKDNPRRNKSNEMYLTVRDRMVYFFLLL